MAGLPEYVRVFTAIELDEEIRGAIFSECGELFSGLGKVSPVREENLHVTMKFVGDVPRRELSVLSRAVAECARGLGEGTVEIGGAGAFPDLRRPRVLWAGVSDPGGILSPVYAKLDVAMAAFGAKAEHRKFTAHVTTARVRGRFDGDGYGRRVEEAGELFFGTQAVEAVTLYMSELSHGEAPRYTVLGHYGRGE